MPGTVRPGRSPRASSSSSAEPTVWSGARPPGGRRQVQDRSGQGGRSQPAAAVTGAEATVGIGQRARPGRGRRCARSPGRRAPGRRCGSHPASGGGPPAGPGRSRPSSLMCPGPTGRAPLPPRQQLGLQVGERVHRGQHPPPPLLRRAPPQAVAHAGLPVLAPPARWARRRCPATGAARAARCRQWGCPTQHVGAGDPLGQARLLGPRGPGGPPGRRGGVEQRKQRTWASRSSMPPRGSTTMPSSRSSSPHTRSTSRASWSPSTHSRDARAVRAAASTATDAAALRRRAGRPGDGAGVAQDQGHGLTLHGERSGQVVDPVLAPTDVPYHHELTGELHDPARRPLERCRTSGPRSRVRSGSCRPSAGARPRPARHGIRGGSGRSEVGGGTAGTLQR